MKSALKEEQYNLLNNINFNLILQQKFYFCNQFKKNQYVI